jgi:hypothetical protein
VGDRRKDQCPDATAFDPPKNQGYDGSERSDPTRNADLNNAGECKVRDWLTLTFDRQNAFCERRSIRGRMCSGFDYSCGNS